MKKIIDSFEFKSKIALGVMIDQIRYSVGVRYGTDMRDKELVMPLILTTIRIEIGVLDLRNITDDEVDYFTRHIIWQLRANRVFADPEFFAIEDTIKQVRDYQKKEVENLVSLKVDEVVLDFGSLENFKKDTSDNKEIFYELFSHYSPTVKRIALAEFNEKLLNLK